MNSINSKNPINSSKLPKDFYTRTNVIQVARDLIGKLLVVPDSTGRRVAGLIVETEAYKGPADKASHAYGNRRTRRTEPMFGRGGIAYVYFVYGMYHQFNVVTNNEDKPHAILVRAVEPAESIDAMWQRRAVKTERDLTSGPGKLCIALGIDRSYDAADLLGDRIWIENGVEVPSRQIASGPRVGIDYAEEFILKPWRFWMKDNPFVSRS